jgi:hypothetical protein
LKGGDVYGKFPREMGRFPQKRQIFVGAGPRGEGKNWPGKISTKEFTIIYNNVVEVEASTQQVVGQKGSLR